MKFATRLYQYHLAALQGLSPEKVLCGLFIFPEIKKRNKYNEELCACYLAQG